MEKLSQSEDLMNSSSIPITQRPIRSIWTKRALIKRLSKGCEVRRRFVESQIANDIAFQIRALRHKREWSQPALARELDTTQNQIYRLENPAKSKPTISTLKKIAALFDLALVVRLVPFSETIDYLTGTPRLDKGLSTARMRPISFLEELPVLESSLMLEEAQNASASIVSNELPVAGEGEYEQRNEADGETEEMEPQMQMAGAR